MDVDKNLEFLWLVAKVSLFVLIVLSCTVLLLKIKDTGMGLVIVPEGFTIEYQCPEGMKMFHGLKSGEYLCQYPAIEVLVPNK